MDIVKNHMYMEQQEIFKMLGDFVMLIQIPEARTIFTGQIEQLKLNLREKLKAIKDKESE